MKKENSDDSSKKRYVFDSYALIALTKHEADYQLVEKLLEQAKRNKLEGYINIVNLGEVFYIYLKSFNKDLAEKLITAASNLPLTIVDLDIPLLKIAASIKAQGGISYADSFVIATSLKYDAVVVTGDKEFKKFEKIVKVEWL